MTMPDYESYGDPLAPLERVAARVPDGIVSEDEIALAKEMILQASEEVRAHGRPWTSADVPPGIMSIVVEAAARGYMNPSGYYHEGSDAVDLRRSDAYTGGAELTPGEIRRVKMLASRSGFGYIQGSKPSHWVPRSEAADHDRTVYVPVDGGTKRWFPWATYQNGRIY